MRLGRTRNLVVLVGPNSTGKSSILDALQLCLSRDPSRNVPEILHRREHSGRWLHHKGNLDVRPNFQAFSPSGQGEILTTYRELVEGERVESGYQQIGAKVEFLDATTRLPLALLWSEVVRQGAGELCLELLRSVLPDLHSCVVLADENNQAELNLQFQDRVTPVSLEGDGLKNLLRDALSLVAHSADVVLMEEPECHRHPAALRQTARLIVTFTQSQHRQLFLTTHSLELLSELMNAWPADSACNFSIVRLARGAKNEIIPVLRNLSEAKILLEEVELDIR